MAYLLKKIQRLFKNPQEPETSSSDYSCERVILPTFDKISEIPRFYHQVFSENDLIAHSTAYTIRDIINKNYLTICWGSFSQSCRYIYIHYPRELSIADLQMLDKFPTEEAANLLGIASMNANGYIREAALCRLEKLHTPAIIPYVLLRLNDGVHVIRNKATEIWRDQLKNFCPTVLIKNHALLSWLETTHRINLKDFQLDLLHSLIRKDIQDRVISYLKTASLKENLFYWQTVSRLRQDDCDIINTCLLNRHPEVRKIAIKHLHQSPHYYSYLEKLLHDPSARIRLAALKSISPSLRKEYQNLFIVALADHSTKVRVYSRFALQTLNLFDIHSFYKEQLKEDSYALRIGYLLGWLEVATLEDIHQIKELLNDHNSKVRLGAYQAFARLDQLKKAAPYLEGLVDKNSKVRKFCAEILKSIACQVKDEATNLLTASRPELRSLALLILAGQTPPLALRSLLYALSLNDETLNKKAWLYFRKWYLRYSIRPYFSISRDEYNELIILCRTIESKSNIPKEYQNIWREDNVHGNLTQLLKQIVSQ